MKQKVLVFSWLLFTAAAALAQSAASSLPSNSAPASTQTVTAPTPAAEPKPKSSPRKASVRKRVPLDPPASAVVKSDAVNVRAQPGFDGEVLGHLKKGETVAVQAEITLSHAPKGEPLEWSQIALPADMPVWVSSRFIDADAHTVKSRRINLRGGPGEEFSVVGRLDKGTTVTEMRKQNGWIAIQAPSNACGFVAASFLDIQTAPAPEAPPPVANVPPVAAAVTATNTPPPVASPATNEPPAAAPVAPVAPAPEAPAPTAPAPTAQGQTEQELTALREAQAKEVVPTGTNAAGVTPRIVTREGYVHRTANVQAPASFELHDVQSDTLIEFLQPAPSAGVNLRTFVGTRVSVTGPELVDQRWPRTPILQVQSIGLIP